jgi:hypothetical protein
MRQWGSVMKPGSLKSWQEPVTVATAPAGEPPAHNENDHTSNYHVKNLCSKWHTKESYSDCTIITGCGRLWNMITELLRVGRAAMKSQFASFWIRDAYQFTTDYAVFTMNLNIRLHWVTLILGQNRFVMPTRKTYPNLEDAINHQSDKCNFFASTRHTWIMWLIQWCVCVCARARVRGRHTSTSSNQDPADTCMLFMRSRDLDNPSWRRTE